MPQHETFMRRALNLAERGRYSVSPNPMVGCVIVRDDEIIAEGWHRRAGEPHAEIEALRVCDDARGATMYVTLEPCAHQGRTPPCTNAVIASGIKQIFIASSDPAHGGSEKLQAAGVEVTSGVLEDDANRLNEAFLYVAKHKRPFVVLKAGMTFDGKLATIERESKWITSDAARRKSLELREQYDAILAGGGTIAADNPHLTRRLALNTAIQPWLRVILDRDRVVPANANVLTDDGPTLHITNEIDLEELLADLYATRNVQSIIVEGGSTLHSAFLRGSLWQKMVVFIAPAIVGGASSPAFYSGEPFRRLTDALRFRFDRVEMVGGDLMVTAYPGHESRVAGCE
jgi:diaminohydroxyphosphoribosylaminopyrimidine deaminase/5-amino-6-(5-phosphoribosylamino)uracil reductase